MTHKEDYIMCSNANRDSQKIPTFGSCFSQIDNDLRADWCRHILAIQHNNKRKRKRVCVCENAEVNLISVISFEKQRQIKNRQNDLKKSNESYERWKWVIIKWWRIDIPLFVSIQSVQLGRTWFSFTTIVNLINKETNQNQKTIPPLITVGR